MLRKAARQLQVEVNSLMAAIDKGEPTPFLIGRLTTIIARCQAGIMLSPIRLPNELEPEQEERKATDGQTRNGAKVQKHKHG
jgi:hypothetical protein